MLPWFNVTYRGWYDIVPVQRWLFAKYAPEVQLTYLDVGTASIKTWGKTVANLCSDKHARVVFGLDDYLPTGPLDMAAFERANKFVELGRVSRFELGLGSRLFNTMVEEDGIWLYGPQTHYSVSCQFSIWKTDNLLLNLQRSSTPWDFEKARRTAAACFVSPAFLWIEESAISKRWPGELNVRGLSKEDNEELIRLGYLDPVRLINRCV